MNPLIQRNRSLRAGFCIVAIADLMASAFFWKISGIRKENIEYWVRDLFLFLPRAGTVVLAIAVLVMLSALKAKGTEAKSMSLVSVVLLALPAPFMIAAAMTSSAWWMAILAYLVYIGSVFGASIASIRIS